MGSTPPDNYATIQEGIDAAANGDTVLVRDGPYLLTAAIDFKGKAITVESEHGASSCFLDGQNATRVVYFHSSEGNDSILRGFTIQNGQSDQGGGGIYVYESSPTITECKLDANNAQNMGGGIYSNASSPIISKCAITGNTAYGISGTGHGGGLYISGGYPVIDHSIITGNQATGGWGCGGGMYVDNSSPSIKNSDISNNLIPVAFDAKGGGIYFSSTTFPSLVNCVISGNSAKQGGGIYFDGAVNFPGLTNCTIVRNIATDNGGGIYFANTSTDIINSILWENSPQNIYFDATSNPNITYSDVGGGYMGTGNIDASPAFVNIALPDFRLTGSSPCINTGSNAAPYLPLLDKDDNARIDSSRVEMGAYEYKYQYRAASLTIFRPDTGDWYVLPSGTSGNYSKVQWGIASDIPTPGDFDGDGTMDIAVYRPSTGIWFLLPSGAPGTYTAIQWGLLGDQPVPGDYDLDGKTDIAVWRPSNGVWYALPSNSPGSYTATQWGVSTDVPIPPVTGIGHSLP